MSAQRWQNCGTWCVALFCVACPSGEDSPAPKPLAAQHATGTPELLRPPAPVREALVVECSGILEQCTEISSPTDASLDAAASRAALYQHVEGPKDRVKVVSGSCSEAFHLRRALATCVISTERADGGETSLEITHRYYLLAACKPGSSAELRCRKAGGTWKVADAKEPAVASERLRQSAKGLFKSLEQATQQ